MSEARQTLSVILPKRLWGLSAGFMRDELLGGLVCLPLNLMNHFYEINARRLRIDNDFFLDCLSLREAFSCFIAFKFISVGERRGDYGIWVSCLRVSFFSRLGARATK